MVLHEKSVMNSGLEHGQSFSHISVLDGIGLKKRKVFQHLWKYIFRNYDSVAERIKVTCCNRGYSVGSLFPVAVLSDYWELSTSLGTEENSFSSRPFI